MSLFALAVIAGYLLGSLPFALWLGRWVKGIDIREHGSGNVGAANAARTLGWHWGALALTLDVGKGLAAVALAGALAEGDPANAIYWRLAAGLAAVAGHVWSIFAKFRGGKGVATAAGVFVGMFPLPTAAALAVYVAVAALTRRASVASLIAALCLPLAMLALKFGFGRDQPAAALVAGVLTVAFVFFTHRANIGRLWRGEEPKLDFKQKRGASTPNAPPGSQRD